MKTGAAIQVRLPVGWILAKDCEDDKIREDGYPPEAAGMTRVRLPGGSSEAEANLDQDVIAL